MTRSKVIATTSAATLYAFTIPALAQSTQQLEIDFANATLPLSPLLTVLIACAVAALGIYTLKRARGRGGIVSSIVLAAAALAIAMQAAHLRMIEVAQAIPQPIDLTVSPTIVTVDTDAYTAINQTGTTIVLTKLALTSTGTYALYLDLSTCAVGLTLPPGATCLVVLGPPV